MRAFRHKAAYVTDVIRNLLENMIKPHITVYYNINGLNNF